MCDTNLSRAKVIRYIQKMRDSYFYFSVKLRYKLKKNDEIEKYQPKVKYLRL